MVRRRTSSVLRALLMTRVGQGADRRLDEAVQVRVVEGLVGQLGRRGQGVVGLHPVDRAEQAGPQRVDLRVRGRRARLARAAA